MTSSKAARETRRQFANLKADEFSRFLERIVDDARDAGLMRYLYVLFLKMYELHLEDRYMTKSQACRYIPLKHAGSCAKYLEEAKALGYIYFEEDAHDRRKTLVKSSRSLLEFVEAELDRSIEATMATVQRVTLAPKSTEQRKTK